MWIVAKYKTKELELFKKNLTLKIGQNIKFYLPKIKYQKIVNNCKIIYGKTILENYIICFHPRFSDKQFLKQLNVTFRRDPTNFRPRINKLNSQKDKEQKAKGAYFFLDSET